MEEESIAKARGGKGSATMATHCACATSPAPTPRAPQEPWTLCPSFSLKNERCNPVEELRLPLLLNKLQEQRLSASALCLNITRI